MLGTFALARRSSAQILRRKGRHTMCTDIKRSGSIKSWVLIGNPEDTTNESIMLRLMDVQNNAVRKVVPWFHDQMPVSYFHSTSVEQRIWHLTAMTGLFSNLTTKSADSAAPEVMVWSPDGTELIHMSHNDSTRKENQLKRTISRNSLNIDFRRLMGSSSVEQGSHKSVPMSVTSDDGDKLYLSRVNKFTSNDGKMTMWSFSYGAPLDGFGNVEFEGALKTSAKINAERALSFAKSEGRSDADLASLEQFLGIATTQHLSLMRSARRLCLHHDLYAKVVGTEDVAVHIETWEGRFTLDGRLQEPDASVMEQKMITVAAPNVIPKLMMSKVSDILTSFDLTINGVHVDTIKTPETSSHSEPGHADLALVRFQVDELNRSSRGAANTDWAIVKRELKRLKWCDNTTLGFITGPHGDESDFDLYRAEVLSGLINLVNTKLGKLNPHFYTRNNLEKIVDHPVHWPIASKIAGLFCDRFDPDREERMTESEFEARSKELQDSIHKKVMEGAQISEESADVLYTMLHAVGATLRTNLFVEDRYALSMRLDPAFMGVNETMKSSPDEELPIPFGTFFIHGRSCDAFHVRFRDISRGGLRVVIPRGGSDAHEIESQRMYDEAYSLAFAQQLKNKDIPEGGSKAVCLVRPGPYSKEDPKYLVRKSVKAFGDALLDLHSTHEETKSRIVDWYGKDEQVYLGPDENIIPEDITWLVDRAGIRGYPIPNAFMSSKPDSGINHKVYGVTSTGVNVFLDVALEKALHINPKQEPFTVKLTGGTDGDVAGNCLKLLDQYYGENARLVGICDGTATIEDPEGIDMSEILRLVDEDLPLSAFKEERAGNSTTFVPATTPEGIAMRNTMHTRVQSDAFVPAGGRPNTINISNYKAFLNEETGKPCSPLIVEGANLFVTPMARKALFDEGGVLIVKDSSANKCGVITSSYEILSSMVASENEFLQHKDRIVEDVQDNLRHLARIEAELLFREFNANGRKIALPQISNRISQAIIRTHDAIYNMLGEEEQHGSDDVLSDHSETTREIIMDHIPQELRNIVMNANDTEERLNRIPITYRRSIIASALSSRIVYAEGLRFVENVSDDAVLGDAVKNYVRVVDDVERLRRQVECCEGLNEEDRNELVKLLRSPGIAAAMSSN